MHSVLVVDDEPFVRVSLASLRDWEEDGFEFLHEASNGREALEVLAVYPEIDLVLVDLSMPVMNGIDFLKRLPDFCRELGRNVPVPLVLSAYNDFPLVRESFTLGAKDYLLKAEIEGDKLLSLLTKATEGLPEDPQGNNTILQRRHRDFLKQHILKDLLSNPPPQDWKELFPSLSILISPPLTLIAHRIVDVESIQERYGEEGLGRFQDLVRRALTQIRVRYADGEIFPLTPWLWVTYLEGVDPTISQDYGSESSDYLDRYISARASFQDAPCPGWETVREVWKGMPLKHQMESRIVILAKRFLREHYADDELSLETVSRVIGVSKNHLSWEFSRETGETLMRYLTRVRIDQAKVFLADPNCRVHEAGARSGYPNVEHFSRVFKKLTGVSPNKWSDFLMNLS